MQDGVAEDEVTVPGSRADRIRLLWLLAPVLIASGAVAQAQPLPESLAACARITEDGARLACYDRIVAAIAPAAATPSTHRGSPSPAAGTAPPDAPATAPASSAAADDFGLPPKPAPQLSDDARRTMTIAEVHRSRTGKLTVARRTIRAQRVR